MDFRELEQAEYDRRLRSVIVGTEGLHANVQDVGDNRATIGWGYTLNRNNNVEIWERSGIELTDAQRDTLARVDAAPAAQRTAIGLTFDKVLTEAESDRLFSASVREYEGPAINAGMPLSDERVALVSVTYNRGIGAVRDHPVVDAISDGDRAEAWYQMRYECWGSREDMEGGLRKRRFAESEIIGLYDDRQNVRVDEAADVYTMYQTHREEIDRVERRFGEAIDGTEATRNRIAQANRDFPDIVAEYGEVRTISASLEPARTVLLEHLREQYPEHADQFTDAAFNAGTIDLERFPVRAGEEQHEAPAAPGDGTPDGRQGSVAPRALPFDDPMLNRMYAALEAGDSDAATRVTVEFAQSETGEAFLRRGQEQAREQAASARAVPEEQDAGLYRA